MWNANFFLYRDMSIYLQFTYLIIQLMTFSISNYGLKITYIVWEWTSSLLGSVNKRINREWPLTNMQQKKGSEKIEMIIKTVNKFKLPSSILVRSLSVLGTEDQYYGQKISGGTDWGQCKGQQISAWDGRSVSGTGNRCLGQKISARDKCSMPRTFHGVIHELLTSILHAQTRCRSVYERTCVQNVCACARSLFSNWRLRMRTSQQECLFFS